MVNEKNKFDERVADYTDCRINGMYFLLLLFHINEDKEKCSAHSSLISFFIFLAFWHYGLRVCILFFDIF